MQVSTQREIPDPKMFRKAYAYDDQGYYLGLVEKQENPRLEGAFLMPGNATDVKPSFKEGFRPRWVGGVWTLEPKAMVQAKAQAFEEAETAKRDKLFRSAETNLQAAAKSLIQEKLNQFEERFSVAIDNALKTHSERMTNLLIEMSRNELNAAIDRLGTHTQMIVDNILTIERRAQDVHAQTLAAAEEIHGDVMKMHNATMTAVETSEAQLLEARKWWQFWKKANPEAETETPPVV